MPPLHYRLSPFFSFFFPPRGGEVGCWCFLPFLHCYGDPTHPPPILNPPASQWGHIMGGLELFMTWIYAVSATIAGLENFVRLSVVTRLGAFLVSNAIIMLH